MTRFQPGSWVHLLALAVCALAILLYIPAAKRFRSGQIQWLPKALALSCLGTWIVNTGLAFTPPLFRWETSLPLFYCNLANLIAAFAILTRQRLLQALLYFWTCGLAIWAFLTPTLAFGPSHIGFWIFWAYHLCIAVAVVHLIAADGFRPNRRDLIASIAVTVVYGLALVALNVSTGWNYAFLGASTPKAPTPIDVLGPFPLRLLWIALLASGIFAALMLPWKICDLCKRGASDSTDDSP